MQKDLSAHPWPFPQTYFDLISFIFWLYKRLLWISHQDGWMVTCWLIKLAGATGHFWTLKFPKRKRFYSCISGWRAVELPHPVTLTGTFPYRHQGPFLYSNPASHSTLNLAALCIVRLCCSSFQFWSVSCSWHPGPLHTLAFPAWSFTSIASPPSPPPQNELFLSFHSKFHFFGEEVLIVQYILSPLLFSFIIPFCSLHNFQQIFDRSSQWQVAHYYTSNPISFWPDFVIRKWFLIQKDLTEEVAFKLRCRTMS